VIDQSSDITKFFTEIIVTKDKVTKIREYYTRIKNNIVDHYDELKIHLENDIYWIQNQISYINELYAAVLNITNDFVAKTSPPSLILQHDKYLELMALYNKYIKIFYDRMNELYDIYKENFLKGKINEINDTWKFHYSENRNDAIRIDKKYSGINITPYSQIVEISSGRFLLFNGENVIYDINHKSKNCFIINYDAKTINNKRNILQGSRYGLYSSEGAQIKSIFKVKNKNSIYLLIDLGFTDNTSLFGQNDIIGTLEDGIPHIIAIAKYDIVKKTISFPEASSKTSTLIIRDKLLSQKENLIVHDEPHSDYYYLQAGKYVVRLKLDGEVNGNIESKIILALNTKIVDMKIFKNEYLVIVTTPKVINIFNLGNTISIANPYKSVSTTTLPLTQGDGGVISSIMVTNNDTIYFTTNRSLWYSSDLFTSLKRDDRIENVGASNINFQDKSNYNMDNSEILYYLHEHSILYEIKKDDVIAVSPTRYPEQLLFLDNVNSLINEGYLYQNNPELYPGENIVFSYIENDTYIGITTSGKVISGNIENAAWNPIRNSLTGNNTVTAALIDDKTGLLYLATHNGIIYTLDKASAHEVNPAVSILLSSDMGSIFAICIYKDILYMAGYIGRVGCYDLNTNIYYSYGEYNPKYITNIGTAIGNVNIRAIDVVSGNLVIAGNAGRIASCNLATRKWTRFNGTTEADEDSNEIDSLIFNNGSALGNFDITAMYNYLGKYLIIFGATGRIASYNIYNSAWTDYTGIPLNPLVLGPPIFNRGDHSNGNTIRSIVLTDKGVVMGCDEGCISSLNPETGGITKYNGVQVDIDRPGPDISFDSSSFEHDILSLAFDIKRNNIIVGTKKSCVATYSINERDLLLPSTSKLYYIGKRDTKHDYLSSLLVEVSKETLFEKKTIFPPREENDVYEYGYDTYFYVYKNGQYTYKLSSTLEDLQQSVNDGEGFINYHINNKDWNYTKIKDIKGYVAKDGTFVLYAVINDLPYLLIAHQKDSSFHASWYNIEISESIIDIGLIDSDFSNRYLFYFTLYDSEKNIKYPALITLNNNDLVLLRDFLTTKITQNNDATTLLNDNIYLTMNNEGRIFSSNEKYLNIFEWNYTATGLSPELNGEPTALINDYTSFLQNLFTARRKETYLDINRNIYCFLGFYALPNNMFNLLYAGRNGNIIVITVYVQKSRYILITQNEMTNSENWSISLNEIQANEYLSVYANNQAFQDSINLSEITINKSYLVLFKNNIKGLLGIDISYYEGYNSNEAIHSGYKEQHIIISLDCEIYKNHISPEYRVYKAIEGKGLYVNHNKENEQLVIASYKEKTEDYIFSIRNIYKFILRDSAPYSPLRALTDYWYNHKIFIRNDINALRIRAKISQLEGDSFKDAIDKQFSFRYEVLITNETNGSYILYEAEKSTINSRVDSDTKTFNTFLRVKAIDGFEDDVIELYSSRLSGRQTAFSKVSTQRSIDNNYVANNTISYDFNTIIQLGKKNRDDALLNPLLYSIKIRPVSNMPSSVDVQFYIEPYKNQGIYGVSKLTNNIKRSEFKSVDFKSNDNNEFYYFSSPDGFLSETVADIPHLTGSLSTTNHELYAQYDMEAAFRRNGFADTLVSFIKGRGNSRYDRVDGIVSNIGYNTWGIIPYSVNRKQVIYHFDSNGTKSIQDDFNINFLKNGRNITKMHEFGIFSPSVINIADYYSDLKGKGRIVKHEGLLLTPHGLYEGIGTLDGRQKRITSVHESNENTVYRYTNHALDEIHSRLYGYSYDFVDRYTIYEIPYYYIRAWWIPARGYIKRSNESLLTLDNDEASHFDTIGQALFPFDYISPPPSISKPNEEDAGGGIGSGGMAADPNVIAFSTLVLEKFPLEHWEGYNDLHFVRFYKDIYMDGHEENRIEIEPPRETIVRNLYHYEDNLDWERRGKEVLKYLTGYYYNRFDWKIYYHEVREITSGYNQADNEFIANNPQLEHLVHDYNASQVLSDVFTEEQWYVNELPEGSQAWPQPVNSIIGERIINMTNPLVDMVAHTGSMPAYNSNSTGITQTEPSKVYCKIYRRGKLYDSRENIGSRGHTMIDVLNPISSRKRLSPLTATVVDTYANTGDPSGITNRINTLNSLTDQYLVLMVMFDAISISTQFRNILKTIGLNNDITLPAGRFRHLLLGASKLTSGMIEHLDQEPTNCYAKGYGYIAPIKTAQWNYADIENINENTPWVVTVKKYRADCNESTENRNMVLTNRGKRYDQYVGIGAHKYLYGTEYNVSLQLYGINPRVQEKIFYYYTIEGNGVSYYSQYTHWWDHRAPSGIISTNIVEREYLRRAEPIDAYKKIIYYIREWLNNGTYRDVEDHHDFYLKWFELNDASLLTIPINDEAGEYFDDYTISGIERYAYYDGTILTIPRTHTMASLRNNFGVTTVLGVSVDSTPSDPYYIRRKITFGGLKINDGGTNSFERIWSTTATYTTEYDSPAGAQQNTSTGTRILKWQD
jgi:hypothetical protein